jgi:hypothetical protein
MRKQRDAQVGRAKLLASLAVGLAMILAAATPALAADEFSLDPPPGMIAVGRSQAITLAAVLWAQPPLTYRQRFACR